MAPCKKSFACVRASLGEARDLVRQYARDAGFPETDVFDIVLAAGEACTNAVLYAATGKGFWVACNYHGRVLTVQIHDFGSGFSVEEQSRSMQPQHRKPGGLGINVMRVLMDEVTYEVGDDGTTVSLVKRLKGGLAARGRSRLLC